MSAHTSALATACARWARVSVLSAACLLGLVGSAASVRAEPAFSVRVVGPDGKPVLDAVLSLEPVGEIGKRAPASTGGVRPKATMDQVELAFVPHVLAVAKGTVVDFPNSDQVRHSIYSFSAAQTFEIKLYKGFEAPPITFDQPGLVVLGCNIHDHMLGFVYVLDAPHFAVSDEQGVAEIAGVASGRYRLELRHPRLDESLVVGRDVELPVAGVLKIALDESPPPRPASTRTLDPLQSLFGTP